MLKKYYDYLIIAAVYLIVFWKILFRPVYFLDYSPSVFLSITKELTVSNFQGTWYLYFFLESIFLRFSQAFFSFSILIMLLIAFYYIKRQFRYSLLFAFVFFFNPFVYSRLMVGQLGVILAYLLIPVFLYYLFHKKNLIILAVLTSIALLLQPQFLLFYLLLFILSYRKPKAVLIFVLLLVLLNAYWIQGFFSPTVFEKIDESHEEFFAPKLSQDVPAVAKIMGMWGFWRETGFKTTYKLLPLGLWYALTLILVVLMLIGYYSSENRFFFSLWWIGVVFATGFSHPYTKPFFSFLFNYLPFFNGFRDSHKFVALIALSYAYLCPLGLRLITKKSKKLKKILYLLFISIILLYTFPLIGLWNQVNPAYPPSDYLDANDFLSKQNITGHIIYLPWEGYLTYNWTINSTPDGRTAVPINKFIQPLVLVSPGRWGSMSNLKHNINFCLDHRSINCLEKQDVLYILKDRCAFYSDRYKWISISKFYENNCLTIYRIHNKTDITKRFKFQLRFVIGSVISILTWICMIFLLLKRKIIKNS
ncbi:hypothetical protein GF361_04105 [Candidatus Woesearchaeota archaeon]|nr:hypothetical protein [Candidatus Woesearchaeota archaeon]